MKPEKGKQAPAEPARFTHMKHPESLTRRVSFWVRHLAGKKGMALAHLADHAGIGRTTMWRLLDVNNKGASDPRLSTVNALAEALDCEPQMLIEPTPDEVEGGVAE